MVSVGIGGFLWRYIAHKERRADERFDRLETKTDYRFDRMEDRIDGLASEVAANGRAIARIEGRLEGRPVALAE